MKLQQMNTRESLPFQYTPTWTSSAEAPIHQITPYHAWPRPTIAPMRSFMAIAAWCELGNGGRLEDQPPEKPVFGDCMCALICGLFTCGLNVCSHVLMCVSSCVCVICFWCVCVCSQVCALIYGIQYCLCNIVISYIYCILYSTVYVICIYIYYIIYIYTIYI